MNNFKYIFLLITILFIQISVFSQNVINKNGTFPIANDTANLILGNYVGDIQWQKSADQENWQDIEGEVNDTLSITDKKTAFYRAKVTVGDCDPFFSDTSLVNFNEFEYIETNFEVFVSETEGYDDRVCPVLQGTDAEGNYFTYYGQFNEDGFPANITDFEVNLAGDDTTYVYHVQDNEIRFFYRIYDGVKENYITYLHYNVPNSIVITGYNYDWITGDSEYLYSSVLYVGEIDSTDYGNTLKASNCFFNVCIDITKTITNIGNHIMENAELYGTAGALAGAIMIAVPIPPVQAIGASVVKSSVGLLATSKAVRGIKSWYASRNFGSEKTSLSCAFASYQKTTPSSGITRIGTYTVPPADTDGDGIYDNIDKCPSSGENDVVGPDGCSLPYNTLTMVNGYLSTKIGDQIWMAKNMDLLPKVNYVDEGSENPGEENVKFYYVYDVDPWGYTRAEQVQLAKNTDSYREYGVLYNGNAALDICPIGWHLPSLDEWTTLVDYVGGVDVAYYKLNEVGNTHWTTSNSSATNEYGFSALPGGSRTYNAVNEVDEFSSKGSWGSFWTSTLSPDYPEYQMFAIDITTSFIQFGGFTSPKSRGFSVRCIKD